MNRRESMWVVIHMAHNKIRSDAAVELLEKEGFVVRTRKIAGAPDDGWDCYEIMALSSEAREARDTLHEAGF